jgi:hypothetical protein
LHSLCMLVRVRSTVLYPLSLDGSILGKVNLLGVWICGEPGLQSASKGQISTVLSRTCGGDRLYLIWMAFSR